MRCKCGVYDLSSGGLEKLQLPLMLQCYAQ